jgi:hypothetical protein
VSHGWSVQVLMALSGYGVRRSVYLGVSIGHWEEFGVENCSLNQSLSQPRTSLTSASQKIRRRDPMLLQYMYMVFDIVK